jgi:hypothetical protein
MIRLPLSPALASPLLNVGFPPAIAKSRGSYSTKEKTSGLCAKKGEMEGRAYRGSEQIVFSDS